MTINRTFDLLDNFKLNHEKSDILVAKREGNWVKFSTDDYIVSVHKVPFTALRLPENYSFTSSKLRIFGLRKPCK
jgi:long-chain acyl-CoA synthetase